VAVAACANVTTALIESGVDPGAGSASVLAVAVLGVAAVLGVLFATRLGGRWAVAGAMAWGLLWIAYGRLLDTPQSVVVGLAAVGAAVVVLAAASRARARHLG
jgi:succinate-acetate transporter protein